MPDEQPVESGAEDTGLEVVEETGAATDQPEGEVEQQRQYVEIDDPDNRFVRVKANEEELEVPYSELVKSYSREADYTRKSQEVAELRRQAEYGMRLQQALDANPQMTLRLLAESQGLTLAEAKQAIAAAEDEQQYQDPLERQQAEHARQLQELQQRIDQQEADRQLRDTVRGLRDQYGLTDDDVNQVINVAYQQGLGIEALPLVWRAMAFDRIEAKAKAIRDREAQKQQETQKREAAKATASQVVTSSSGASQGALTNIRGAEGPLSIREAIEMAIEASERS